MNRGGAKINSTFGFVVITIIMSSQNFYAFGQDDWSESGEIENAEIIIEKDRQVSLPTAVRPFSKIPPAVENQRTIPQTYDFNEYQVTGSAYDPNLKAKIIAPDEKSNIFKNYVKGGFGNYASALAEGSLNTSNRNFAAGLLLKHISFAKGPVDGSNSAASNTDALLFTRLAQKKSVVSVDLGFSSVKRHYYGYAEPATVDPDKQVYNTIGFGIGLKSTDEQSAFDYGTRISFYRLGDNFDASERGFKIALNSKVSIDENVAIRLNSNTLLSKYEDTSSMSRNLARFISGIEYTIGQLSILGAANVVLSNESLASAKNLRIYPHVIANYNLSNSWNLTGGLRGDLETVTLQTISKENEYVSNNLPILHSNKEIEIFASIAGSITPGFGVTGGFSFAGYENLYFYANSFNDSTRFDLIYDFDGTDVLNIYTGISISPVEELTINGRLDFYNYNTKSLNSALHRPDIVGSLAINYLFNQKFLAGFDASLASGIEGLNLQSGNSRKLSTIADLNVNFEYNFNKNLGAFLQINNILSQDYERYLNYRNRTIMVQAGVRYSF